MKPYQFGLTLTLTLILVGLTIAAGASLPSATSPAAQSTVNAAVDAAFTQTAEAASADTLATASFRQTVDAAIAATLTATFSPPRTTPTQTPPPTTPAVQNTDDTYTTSLVFTAPRGRFEAIDIMGETVAAGTSNGDVYLWDINTGEVIVSWTQDAGVRGVMFNPAAPELIVTGFDGTVSRWNTATGESLPVANSVVSNGRNPAIPVGFAPDGSQVAIFSFDGVLGLYNTADMALVETTENLSFALLDFGTDTAAITPADDPESLNILRGETVINADLPSAVSYAEAVDFSADGSRLIVTTDTATNYVIDTTTGQPVLSYPITGYGLSTFSPEATQIADLGVDGVVTLYDGETGTELTRLEGHTAAGLEARFNADGSVLITIAEDGTARVWQTDTTAEPQTVTPDIPAPTVAAGPTPLPEGFPPVTDAEIQVAEQLFEGGRMFWVAPVNQIWVMIITDDQPTGQWLVYPDNFVEGEDIESDPDLVPPEGLYQPERGFGKLWRENPEIRDALGWGITPEFGYVSRYVYVPGGEMVNGAYEAGPGFHLLYSLAGEEFRFNEDTGMWRLGR